MQFGCTAGHVVLLAAGIQAVCAQVHSVLWGGMARGAAGSVPSPTPRIHAVAHGALRRGPHGYG